jgi:hypothetical protein
LIAAGALLWHLALGAMLLVVWRLTVRLGRAMRDDVGPIALFPVAAFLIWAAGVCLAAAPLWALGDLVGALCDLAGAGLGWYAAWHSWGWLVAELRRGSGKGG